MNSPKIVRYCVVPNCDNIEKFDGDDVLYHPIPANSPIQTAWLKFLYSCNLQMLPGKKVDFICSDHFREEDYVRDLKSELVHGIVAKSLKRNAIPSIKDKKEKEILAKLKNEKYIKTVLNLSTETPPIKKNEFNDDKVLEGELKIAYNDWNYLPEFMAFASTYPTVNEQKILSEGRFPKFANYFIECKCRFVETREIGIQCDILQPQNDNILQLGNDETESLGDPQDLQEVNDDEYQQVFQSSSSKPKKICQSDSSDEDLTEKLFVVVAEDFDVPQELKFENGQGKLIFKCPHCKRQFISRGHWKRHQLSHMESSTICTYCGDSFTDYKRMKKHERSCKYQSRGIVKPKGEWPRFSPKFVITKDKKKIYPCNQCHRSFRTSLSLRNHVDTKHSIEKFRCTDCVKIFNTRYGLHAHMKRHIISKQCPHCKKIFNYENYISHLARRRCFNKKDLFCGFCENSKAFQSVEELKEHEANVHDPFTCDICDQEMDLSFFYIHFVSSQHEEREKDWCSKSGIEKYSCSLCPEMYFQCLDRLIKHNVTVHKMSREQNKNYVKELMKSVNESLV